MLKLGDVGEQVVRLHGLLRAAGHIVEAAEVEAKRFGASTQQALVELQAKLGVAVTGELDEATTAAVEIIVEPPSSRRRHHHPTPSPPGGGSGGGGQPPPKPAHGVVHGNLVDQDGAPLATAVAAFDVQLRSETRVGQATSDAKGHYEIRYTRPQPPNLLVRAYDGANNVIAASATVFAAAAEVEIDLTTAKDGVVRVPSRYTTLLAEVTAALRGTPLADLVENSQTHEVAFVANAIGETFDEVARLYVAHKLAAQNGLRDETLFGIVSRGIPASLDAALGALPDAGIDPAFLGQVMSGVLAHERDVLSAALFAALSANVIPASYASAQEGELTLLDGLRVTSVGGTPYVRGKTSLNDLLAAGNVAVAAKTAFVKLYADNGGRLDVVWAALDADKTLSATDLAQLKTTLDAGDLLAGNVPLLTYAFAQLAAPSGAIKTLSDLARLNLADWKALLKQVDPTGQSIPPVVANQTLDQRVTYLAKTLVNRFASRFPTVAFAGGLAKATTSAFKTKAEIVTFLGANPGLDIARMHIDAFIADPANKVTPPSTPALVELKTAQRLLRVSPHYTSLEALMGAGYTSAQSIYFKGRAAFMAHMSGPLGSASLASAAFARAEATYAAALTAYGNFNAQMNPTQLPIMGSPAPAPGQLQGLPDLQSLFGNLDYCECADCRSVLSPAAYLVDLLQFLEGRSVLDGLLARRPDLQYIALDCNNTNTILPYIDLVNELLEASVAPPASPPTYIDTLGTSAERRAMPQQITQAAYDKTAGVVYPLSLPFDLPFAETTAYLGGLGTSLAAVMGLFPPAPGGPGALAGASLGINPEMRAVITTESTTPWVRWGLLQTNNGLADPTSPPPPATPLPPLSAWTDVLTRVLYFLARSGLELPELYQLLECRWVTGGAQIVVRAGIDPVTNVVECAIAPMTLSVPEEASSFFDRANRFIRLWRATGLAMWELDWALAPSAAPGQPTYATLDDTFIGFLAGALALRAQLGLPFQEVLALWAPIETHDVTNHLEDEDAMVASTYDEVFRNAVMQAAWNNVFVDVEHGQSFPQPTTDPNNTDPTKLNVDTAQHALSAALGIGASDIQAILATLSSAPAANQLSAALLSTLFRYARLASTQSLSVSNLILWIALTGQDPFGGPTGTTEFLRRLGVLQGAGLAAVDLDYLLRGQSESKTALAFTAAQAATLLDAVRTDLAKLAVPRPSLAFLTGATTPQYALQAGQVLSLDVGAGFQSVVFGTNNVANLAAAQPAEIDLAVRAVFPNLFVEIDTTGALRIVNAAAPGFLAVGPATTAANLGLTSGSIATDGGQAVLQTPPVTYPVNLPAGSIAFALDGVAYTATLKGGSTSLDAILSAFNAAVDAPGPVALPHGTPASGILLFGLAPGGSVKIVGDSAGGAILSALGLTAGAAITAVSPASVTPALIQVVDALRAQSALTQALAAAVATAPDLIALVLAATKLLPLTDAATSDLLVAGAGGSFTYEAGHFPAITSAFTIVAKAAALFTALHPTAAELAFLVQHAGDFAWLDVTTLPAAPPAMASPYTLFERLLQALHLDQRQLARSPKLFDILGLWLASAPPNATTAISGASGTGSDALATALAADPDDLTAIALAVGAVALDGGNVLQQKTVGSLPALEDVSVLTSIAGALDVVARYHIKASTLVSLSAPPPTAGTAAAARATFQAQYGQAQWFKVIQPIEDALRMQRRDALVAYLLAPPAGFTLNGVAFAGFPTTDEMFGYFLIDPEMSCCAVTTRLLQASLAVQQFVQRCYLNLEAPIVVDTSADPAWSDWSWMGQFRLWQANRQVFLYPENYLLPELRRDKSSFFSDLENDIQQGPATADTVETAYENYLRKLVDVSKSVVRAHYHETRSDGSDVLHVLARTRATPPVWYYRQRTAPQPGSGKWSAWETVSLDIPADAAVLPVVWDRRLYVFWPVFKSESAQQGTQTDPTSNSSSAAPPPKFWAIEFAFSDRRAGQWQAKRTLAEKMFLGLGALPPQGRCFRAAPDSDNNLLLIDYSPAYDGIIFQGMSPVQHGVLPSPDDRLNVTVTTMACMPDTTYVDVTQEPSFSQIAVGPAPAGAPVLPRMSQYAYWGQDFVFNPNGEYYLSSQPPVSTNVPLNVLRASQKGQSLELMLLGSISDPHLILPQQEPVWDSTDPFFVSSTGGNAGAPAVSRVFLVEPTNYVDPNAQAPLPRLAYATQWMTSYTFSPFYHPFARTLLRELEIGGIPQLMQRSMQTSPQETRGWSFDFKSTYQPASAVSTPYPVEDVDFSTGGAYSLYNWELFYHAPMFVASVLMQNQQYQDAMTWLEYIFNPTDSSHEGTPNRYWVTRPLYELKDWYGQQIQVLLTADALNPGASDPAVTAWMNDPYDPFGVADLRVSAYGKATVMKLLDDLIAWGDSLFSQDTMESVSQAEQLYVLASMILGPRPERVRLPAADQPSDIQTATYASIKNSLGSFSNALVAVENVVSVPLLSLLPASQTPAYKPKLPNLLQGDGKVLYFCIPPNATLLAYWDTVADRLNKIRNCLNIAGAYGQPALYAPPINPLALIAAATSGATSYGQLSTWQPVYRFQTYLQKAVELTSDVRAFGGALLAALEKGDAEALALLRSGQEIDVLTRTRDVKAMQLTETTDQINALQKQRLVAQARHDFYSNIAFMNPAEVIAISMQSAALVLNAAALVVDLTSVVAHVLPDVTGGAAGFGGSPMLTATDGGSHAGHAAMGMSGALHGIAGLLSEGGQIAGTMGAYQRRAAEWGLQATLAQREMDQVDAQMTAATDRQNIAQLDLNIHDVQIANAQAVEDFLNNKYTNQQLYTWMATQLTNVYTRAYQLALDLAQKANLAYNYELGNIDSFIQTAYWNDQYKGLQAGESLLLDLRRMEAAYLEANTRELELTKQISLALTQPAGLVALRETGSCSVSFPEDLFDRDHPGHYFRRLRSVAITVPCVTGPYTGVNATLTLGTSAYRTTTALASSYPPDLGGASAPTNYASTGGGVQVATSTGQNDAGLFEVNLRDERWLPFEGRGAISTWSLELRPEDNAFDPTTITDVVFHVRYTARPGSNADAVRKAIKPINARQILVSVRDTFGDAYDAFFNPTGASPTQQTLSVPLYAPLFPYSNLGKPNITDVKIYFVLTSAATSGPTASFGPDGGAVQSVTFTQDATSTTLWAEWPSAATSAVGPGPFTLTLPVGSFAASQVRDVLLVITYSIK
jgi:hypothetical protein